MMSTHISVEKRYPATNRVKLAAHRSTEGSCAGHLGKQPRKGHCGAACGTENAWSPSPRSVAGR